MIGSWHHRVHYVSTRCRITQDKNTFKSTVINTTCSKIMPHNVNGENIWWFYLLLSRGVAGMSNGLWDIADLVSHPSQHSSDLNELLIDWFFHRGVRVMVSAYERLYCLKNIVVERASVASMLCPLICWSGVWISLEMVVLKKHWLGFPA